MTKSTEEVYIAKCIQRIEKKLNWGNSKEWTNYDFEKLSTIIRDETNVALSVTTLKRLCGKIKYDNLPTVTTLNTLAKFVGYEDWRSFKQNGNDKGESSLRNNQAKSDRDRVKTETSKNARQNVNFWLIGLLCLLPIVFIFYVVPSNKVDLSKFQFEANKIVSEGVPNSVVFTYDASAAKTDSVFIVQTWDIRRKALVSKDKHQHSAIYYYPGFFRSKLIVGNQIVKTHDIMITSDGWTAVIEDEKTRVPLYFKKDEFVKDNRIEVDKATLQAYNLSLQPNLPRLRFINVKNMGDLMNDNFTFETTLKNDFNEGTAACQNVQVLILCKDDVIIIPLSAKPCIGDLYLVAAGKQVASKEADLSKFGCDLTQWTSLKVEAKNKHMKFFVNGVEAYSLTFPNDPTGIVGMQYRFDGVGAIKDTKFVRGERVIKLN